MNLHTFSTLCLITAVLPLIASAQSLGFKQKMADQDTQLAEELKTINDACGTTVTAAFDWPTFANNEADLQTYSASGYCGDAFDAAASLCADALGKEAVTKGIKSVSCKLGKERAVELKDGVLTYTLQWDAANNADYIKEYLLKTLQ
jgi:hypothetical protein